MHPLASRARDNRDKLIMGYATLKTVKDWITSEVATCDDDKLRDAVNDIRSEFYLWYQELALFLDALECFDVQTFCRDCNRCDTQYRGLTLPHDFQTVEALWSQDQPIPLNGEWRDWRSWDPRIHPQTSGGLSKQDVAGAFPTERDMRRDGPRRLIVRGVKKSDIGKRFLIRGVDAFDRAYSQEFALTQQNQQTTEKLKFIERRGGIVKDPTVGRVFLSDEDGYKLSVYEPHETMPAYRRIEIFGLPNCEDAQVNVRAARQYFPLYEDDDVVETDNKQAFRNMASYLRLHFKVTKTVEDLRSEKDFLATAKLLMLGQKTRETGRNTIHDVNTAVGSMPARAQLYR